MFNENNTGWKTGEYPLFCGQAPALHDTINVRYPQLQALALRQVSQRWVFDEFNHDQSRMDLLACPQNIYQVMLMNIAYQWEADSVACRAIPPVFAPYVTNPEFWELLMENANMEVTHAKTYSDIVRQCVADPNEVFKMVMESEQTLARADTVNAVFKTALNLGACKTLREAGISGYTSMGDAMFYDAAMMALVALYALERIQFMSSFAATFAIVEQGYFQSIGKAVQKIMLDELFVHAAADREALKIELATERGAAWLESRKHEIKRLLDEVVAREVSWAPHLLAEGRSIVGYTVPLATAWTAWNAAECYELLGVVPERQPETKNPLPWMDNWINIDRVQNAMQEASGNNYALNVVRNDVGEEKFEF